MRYIARVILLGVVLGILLTGTIAAASTPFDVELIIDGSWLLCPPSGCSTFVPSALSFKAVPITLVIGAGDGQLILSGHGSVRIK